VIHLLIISTHFFSHRILLATSIIFSFENIKKLLYMTNDALSEASKQAACKVFFFFLFFCFFVFFSFWGLSFTYELYRTKKSSHIFFQCEINELKNFESQTRKNGLIDATHDFILFYFILFLANFFCYFVELCFGPQKNNNNKIWVFLLQCNFYFYFFSRKKFTTVVAKSKKIEKMNSLTLFCYDFFSMKPKWQSSIRRFSQIWL